MPDNPETPEGGDEPMTIAEICDVHGVSRQTLHRLRADPDSGFPEPVRSGGSTRLRYPRRAVAHFFAENPLRPGKRTDLKHREQ